MAWVLIVVLVQASGLRNTFKDKALAEDLSNDLYLKGSSQWWFGRD